MNARHHSSMGPAAGEYNSVTGIAMDFLRNTEEPRAMSGNDTPNQTAAEQVLSEDEILKAADRIQKRRLDEENERETIAVLRRQNAAMRGYLTKMALSGKIPGCWDSAWGRLPDILNNS